MKGKRVISALCGFAMLLTGFGLTSTTAVADDGKLDQQVVTQDVGGGDNQQKSGEDATTDSGDNEPQGDSSVKDKTPEDENQGITPFKSKSAAPDITLNDELTEDKAYVSKIKQVEVHDGTAPFDKDNARGNDSGDNNRIVRSFDNVVYNYEIAATPDDDMQYYKNARMGIKFILPYDKNYVTFDKDSMLWGDTTPGYEKKVTQETYNGQPAQVLTMYRKGEPTQQASTVVPGTWAVSLNLKVGGAPHGFKFKPIVQAWMVPNTEKHRVLTFDASDEITVSAKLNLNVRISGGNSQASLERKYDFGVGNDKATHKDLGIQRGVLSRYSAEVDLRWPDLTKGIKGLEVPRGDITFDVTTKNRWCTEGKCKTADGKSGWGEFTDDHTPEASLQSYFFDAGSINWFKPSIYGRVDSSYFSAYDNYDYASSTDAKYWDNLRKQNIRNGIQDNGAWSIKEDRQSDKTVYHVTISGSMVHTDDMVQAAYVTGNANSKSQCSFTQGHDCQVQTIIPVSSQYLVFFNPTTLDGKAIPTHYNEGSTELRQSIVDGNATATSITNYKLPASSSADDRKNQSVTGDDVNAVSKNLRAPGTFIQRIMYHCLSSGAQGDNNGTDCGSYKSPDAHHGYDSTVAGQTIAIHSGTSYWFGDAPAAPVFALNLVKFDPDFYQVDKVTRSNNGFGVWYNNSGSAAPTWSKAKSLMWYAVKKDGKNWKSGDEQSRADINSLSYYSTYEEGKKHGAIVGILQAAPTAMPLNLTTRFGQPDILMPTNPNKVNGTTQITGVAVIWRRGELAKLSGLDPDDSTDEEWEAWANKQNPLDIYNQVGIKHEQFGPLTSAGDNPYYPAEYTEDGALIEGSGLGDNNRGDTLHLVSEEPRVSKSVAQKDDAGKTKTVFDLDKDQRTVDWVINARTSTQKSSSSALYYTDMYLTDTLPKGLTYLSGSARVGGAYAEATPNAGIVTGGKVNDPQITTNKDGTSTLKWTITGVPADGNGVDLHYSTTIGDELDPDKDVANGDQFVNTVTIQSRRNKTNPSTAKGSVATATMQVSKLHASALAIRANPLLNDINKQLGFTNRLSNFSSSEKANAYAVNIMPYMGGGTKSAYNGSYVMDYLKIASPAKKAPLDKVKVYFTTDPKYRTYKPASISLKEMQTWHQATYDASSMMVTIPSGYSRPTAWGFYSPSLPADSQYNFQWHIQPTGNTAGDSYVAEWEDDMNEVSAVTQVVERRLNGVAWFDYNNDGNRQDTDKVLPNVKVSLLDSAGKVVTNLAGQKAETTTDANGYYELRYLPAGSGYRIRFTAANGTVWDKLNVTVKHAKDASENRNSDADAIKTGGKLTAAGVTLKEFPTSDKMQSQLYIDTDKDVGLYGKLTVKSANIPVRKWLEGKDAENWQHSSDYDDTYTVEVKPVDGAPAEGIKTPIKLSDDKAHNLEVNGEAFPHEGDFKYEITEKRGSLKGVTYDPQVYELTVHVADDLNTLTRTITSSSSPKGATEQNTETVFHNVYAPAPTQLHMTARKVLENSPHALQAGEFSFGLYEADTHKRLQTKTNDANGEVTFDDITYDKAGLYRYYIQEDKGTEPGITYNTAAKSAVVNVTDDRKGSLHARVLYNDKAEEPVITNKYSATKVSVNIQAHKNLTGRDLKVGEFTFQLFDGSNKKVSEVANDSAGVATFPAVTFDKVGVYNYTVKEKAGNLPHVAYDKGIRNVTITVTDDGNGNLVAHTDYGEGATSAEFTNTYTPESLKASFKATKHLTGKTLKAGQFQFELVDPNGQVVQTKSNGSEGGVLFDPIKFTAAGDYVYHIREKIPAEQNGVQYDTTDHQVVAHVRANEHTGDLSMTVEYQTAGDNETTGAVFTNVYSAQATWGIHGTKTLTGRDMQAGEFKFFLKDAQDSKVAETTVGAGADGQSVAYQFPDVTKTTAEMDADATSGIAYKTATGYVYNYTVEEDTSNLGSGVSAKTAVQTVEVVITDNDNGTMTVAQNKGTAQNPVAFSNDYSVADATVQIAGKKKLTSDSQGVNLATISGKFHFTISAATDSAPLPVQTDVTNQADGTIDFGQITYKQGILGGAKQKDFRYQVRETGSVAGITNDTNSTKDFTVTVKDNGKGTLTATTNKALGELFEFTNRYTSNGAEVPVNVTKTLTGKNLRKGEFTFQVKSADGTVLLEGTNGKNAASGEASTSEIGKLRFLHEGTYTYTVVEKNTGEQGITYDTSKYQFTVTVTNDGKGNLQASVHGQDGASGSAVHATFRNAYKPSPVDVGIRSSKTLVGRDMKAGEFNFILKNAIGETVKTVSNTAAKDGKSSVLDFGKLSYDYDKLADDVEMGLAVPDAQGGYTYGYSISEDKSNLPEGITAPSKVAFSVRVSDAGNGKLQAEVISAGKTVKQDNGIATVEGLTNRYVEKNNPLQVGLRGIKTLSVGEGLTKPDITGKFRFALSGSEGAPMPSKRSVTNDASGNVVFGDVTFNSTDFKEGETKVFTYTVKETGSVEGVTNDSESTKTFTVKVTRKNSTLSAVVADGVDTAFTFVNKYTAKPVQVEIGGDKTLTGRSQKAGEFSFDLKNDKGEKVATATTSANAKDGEAVGFKFPAQTFSKPGIYSYLVSEESGNKGGVTYDTSVYKVQVTVTDNGKGALQAVLTYPDGQKGIHFKNAYKPAPETTALDVTKTLNGRDMLGDESFKIKVKEDKSGAEGIEDKSGAEGIEDKSGAEGIEGKGGAEGIEDKGGAEGAELKSSELLFQNLKNGAKGVTPDYVTFTKTGTYGYSIFEESGNAVGVTYDKSVYFVKYVVTDDGNGHLVVKTFFGKDKGKLSEFKPAEGIQRPAAEFVNTYTPVKHNSIDVEKYDEKSGLQDGDRDDPKDALTVHGDTIIDIKVTNTGDETLTDLTVKDKTVEGSGTLGEIKLPQTTLKPGESIVVSAPLTGINVGDSHRDTVTAMGKTPEGGTVTDKDDWNGKRSIIPAIPSLAQTGASVAVLGLFALAAAGLGFVLSKCRRVKATTGKHSK